MEVVGHHIEEIDKIFELREIEIGNFFRSCGGGHRDLIAAARFSTERIELLAHQLQRGHVMGPVVR